MRNVQSIRDQMGNAAIPNAKVLIPWNEYRGAVTDSNVQRLLQEIDELHAKLKDSS